MSYIYIFLEITYHNNDDCYYIISSFLSYEFSTCVII